MVTGIFFEKSLEVRCKRAYNLLVPFKPSFATQLSESQAGGVRAQQDLLEVLYKDLKRIAANLLKAERRGHTLQPTALVNEAYHRLLAGRSVDIADRHHFLALAGKAMRRVLVDYARKRNAAKRGVAIAFADLEEAFDFDPNMPDRFLEVDLALEKLAVMDPRLCQVVEMRFFAGLTEAEIGQSLGLTERTIKRDWKVAQAWLQGELKDQRRGRSQE